MKKRTANEKQILKTPIVRITDESTQTTFDNIAVEAPLEIQISYIEQNRRIKRSLAITMRTPGADQRLAYGFLFTEGIIGSLKDITQTNQLGNTIKLALKNTVQVPSNLNRSFLIHSSCGICGNLP